MGDEDDSQILKVQIQSLEEEAARRDVEQEAYHADYSALEGSSLEGER